VKFQYHAGKGQRALRPDRPDTTTWILWRRPANPGTGQAQSAREPVRHDHRRL